MNSIVRISLGVFIGFGLVVLLSGCGVDRYEIQLMHEVCEGRGGIRTINTTSGKFRCIDDGDTQMGRAYEDAAEQLMDMRAVVEDYDG